MPACAVLIIGLIGVALRLSRFDEPRLVAGMVDVADGPELPDAG